MISSVFRMLTALDIHITGTRCGQVVPGGFISESTNRISMNFIALENTKIYTEILILDYIGKILTPAYN
jgi:hypothetical protein